MNITFLIGNGFDINLGLKTRYSDFYEYYATCESTNDLIVNLKKAISEDIENWSDLELAFGVYTSKLNNIAEFDLVYEDIVECLGQYLEAAETKFDRNLIKLDKFQTSLYSPESYLTTQDIEEIRLFKRKWVNSQWNVNIINFNYTTTIESILDDKYHNHQIGVHNNNSYQILLQNIEHIHGFTDENLILGVNDLTQVSQLEFHNNRDIINTIIKKDCNKSLRHNIDKSCENLIVNSDLICIYGSSIGDTDKYWWELIGEQLKREIKLIIFSKGEELNLRFAHRNPRMRNMLKEYFLKKTGLSENEQEAVSDKIYIGINTSVFSILKQQD